MSFQTEIDSLIKAKRLYFVGDKLPVDWYEAFKMWFPLAETGDAKAQFNVGRCYSKGDGVEKNQKKGIEWLLKASNQSEIRSNFNLSIVYAELNDKSNSELYLRKAADLGEPRALETLAERLLCAGDKSGAKAIYYQLVESGYVAAKIGLVACDVDIEVNDSSVTNYSTYQSGVVTNAYGRVSGGGEEIRTYSSPAVKYLVSNKSQYPVFCRLWLEMFDDDNPNRKIRRQTIDSFPMLDPGGTVEKVDEVAAPPDINAVRLYLVGYEVALADQTMNRYYKLEKRQLVYLSQTSGQSGGMGCFTITGLLVLVISILIFVAIKISWWVAVALAIGYMWFNTTNNARFRKARRSAAEDDLGVPSSPVGQATYLAQKCPKCQGSNEGGYETCRYCSSQLTVTYLKR